jgi:hypothetical protein
MPANSIPGRNSFVAIGDFYDWPTSNEHQRQIWGWIHDEKIVGALVAVEVDSSGAEVGGPQGLARLREWMRPLRGVMSGFGWPLR